MAGGISVEQGMEGKGAEMRAREWGRRGGVVWGLWELERVSGRVESGGKH